MCCTYIFYNIRVYSLPFFHRGRARWYRQTKNVSREESDGDVRLSVACAPPSVGRAHTFCTRATAAVRREGRENTKRTGLTVTLGAHDVDAVGPPVNRP